MFVVFAKLIGAPQGAGDGVGVGVGDGTAMAAKFAVWLVIAPSKLSEAGVKL